MATEAVGELGTVTLQSQPTKDPLCPKTKSITFSRTLESGTRHESKFLSALEDRRAV
jgi:hypothetical protein